MSCSFFAAVDDASARISRAPHLLVCIDIENILPPAHEPSARLAEPWRRQLQTLSADPRFTLAMLSGRNRNELQTQVGIPGLVYVGNLGLEISGAGFVFVEPTAAGYSDALAILAGRLTDKLAKFTGARVKNKGLTIRIDPSEAAGAAGEEIRRVIHEMLASTDHPFHLTSRDNVYEIRPRVAWGKASAVAWVRDRLDKPENLVIYLSDDAKDEETIAAIPGAVTIKVGGPVETLANYRLEGVAEVERFLSWLSGVQTDVRK